MPRNFRSRIRTQYFRGKVKSYSGPDETASFATTNYELQRTSFVSDFHGRPVTPNSFDSTQQTGALLLSGIGFDSLGRLNKFESVPHLGGIVVGVYDPTPLAAPSGWMLSLVAGTNPSRPVVTPPQLLQNLIELPKMIKNLLKFLYDPRTVLTPRGAANEYLGLRFGWLPLIDDIKTLLDIQNQIAKRTKELDELYNSPRGGSRRKLRFGKENTVIMGYSEYALQGPTSKVRALVSIDVTKQSWATIRWKPLTPPPFHIGDIRFANHVRNIVLGLTPEGLAKGLWDVIPWTWLLGWFTNIGRYTLAHSNTVPATHSVGCFMSEVVVNAKPGAVQLTAVTNGKFDHIGEARYTRKTRIVSSSVTPGFNMPFLDMSRLSILGALGIQRLRVLPLFRN